MQVGRIAFLALLGNCVEFAINCWDWLCIELLNVGNPVHYSQRERWVFSFSWVFVLFFYCRPSWVSSIMQINKHAISIMKAVILGTLVSVPGMCVQQIFWRVFTQNWILQHLGVHYLLEVWKFMESRAGFWGDMYLMFKRKGFAQSYLVQHWAQQALLFVQQIMARECVFIADWKG